MAAAAKLPQPDAGAGWDEAQCIAALAQLERLKTQLDDLRLAIPRVVEPFYSPPTPAMFRAFKQGVIGSQNEIKSFRNQWHDQDTQAIFDHARKSMGQNPDLSASAQVQQYGWIEKESREKEAALLRKDGAQEAEEAQVALTQEDISRILDDFHKTYPNLNLTTENGNHNIMIQFVSTSASAASRLRFRVIIEQKANGQHKLNAECLGTADPSPAITRCIASRPQANDLKYLLDMIAAYKTVKGTSCAKCKKMFDNEMIAPAARRSKQVTDANETSETVWEAFHEGCLD
ncbi:hypothetical protein BU26DRAFT_174172 [Trematosphaeria pertusa]|uniref:Uncharacterized protein n=1 Tax=Trematosphaeria pertusa TaxID=390896 RepID=A0A6A6HUB3_9PLEO|nr:uncharacterized protein BU26DRAFT_174172 [Trematosphaeria pertusa]KAF2241601.1 hypothetical protein BU26DRAFT_174172 [Trematosphaeria pertusa]